MKHLITTARRALCGILSDPSNKGQRLKRLTLGLAWQMYKRTIGLPLVVKLDNGMEYVLEPLSTNSGSVVYTRVYEAATITFLRDHLVPGGYFCDVGAHSGLFALLLASRFRGGICFEPAEDMFRLLRRNLGLNGLLPAYELCATAISSRSGTGFLWSQTAFDGQARLRPEPRLDGNGRCAVVSVSTVDEALLRREISDLALLKIDVEGHEVEVLRGAGKALRKNPAALVVLENNAENFESALDQMASLGLRVFAVSPDGAASIEQAVLSQAQNLFACGPQHPLRARLS
jgi:FkbM family methyltransferase